MSLQPTLPNACASIRNPQSAIQTMLRETPELQFRRQAVRAASRLVRLVQQEMVSPELTKDDKSPVTVGDFAAQAVVASLLEEAFPNDALVGEESAAALRTGSGIESLVH